MKLKLFLTLIIGVVAGFVLATLLHNYPAGHHEKYAYCLLCGIIHHSSGSESILGGRSEIGTDYSVLAELLHGKVGQHEHQWMDPPAQIFPVRTRLETSQADFKLYVAQKEWREYKQLEKWPHAIALLDAAMSDNPERTVQLVQRILDPDAQLGPGAILLLDRAGSWEERWQLIEKFLDSYQCEKTTTTAVCSLPVKGQRVVVYQISVNGYSSGGVDWANWEPEASITPVP